MGQQGVCYPDMFIVTFPPSSSVKATLHLVENVCGDKDCWQEGPIWDILLLPDWERVK